MSNWCVGCGREIADGDYCEMCRPAIDGWDFDLPLPDGTWPTEDEKEPALPPDEDGDEDVPF